MSGVETTDTTYKRRSDFNASTFFQYSTGIMESKSKPEEVLLTITKPISDLILLEPLHQSQKIIKEKADSLQISLKVLLNEEFTFKLLGMGSFCIVNKPLSLKKNIKSAIDNMGANYL
jgi:predicted DNA-binding transcriptional regulator YafY